MKARPDLRLVHPVPTGLRIMPQPSDHLKGFAKIAGVNERTYRLQRPCHVTVTTRARERARLLESLLSGGT